MFCCRGSKCLDDGEPRQESGKRIRNQQIFNQVNTKMKDTGSLKMAPKFLQNNLIEKPKTTNHSVRHVTNVQRDLYVKLNGLPNAKFVHRSNTYSGGNFKVLKMPNSQNVVRTVPKRIVLGTVKPMTVIQSSQPVRDSMRLSTEFKVPDDNNRTSTPFGLVMENGGIKISDDEALAIFETSDSESLADDQKNALEQLDDTLKSYQSDDDETPMIIADVLPYGEFEAFKIVENSPAESSEDEPSSRSSSLSNKSVNSRTGIISQKRQSVGSKKNRNSVSFKLPIDHVDKPYAPMQVATKPKMTTMIVTQSEEIRQEQTALCISGNDVSIWHNGSKIVVENKHRRRLSGPFKGSFKSLFYGKYGSSADLNNYNERNVYLAPKIMDKVESFESLTGDLPEQSSNKNAVIIRRNTIR